MFRFVSQEFQTISKAQELYYNLAMSKHDVKHSGTFFFEKMHATLDSQLVKIETVYTSAQIYSTRCSNDYSKGKQHFVIYFPNVDILMIKGKLIFAIYFSYTVLHGTLIHAVT